MTEPASEQQLAAEFAQLRPYLLGVAYSHLGSLSEAEVRNPAKLGTLLGSGR